MRTVWKYELALIDEPQTMPMPAGATVVHVADQKNRLCLWAEVDPDAEQEERRFVVEGTGHPIDHDGVHVGTALQWVNGVSLVWHVYEVADEG